jgi:hypothetical protein
MGAPRASRASTERPPWPAPSPRGHEVDLATAATDYGQQHQLLPDRERRGLRAGTRIVDGDIAGGLTLALPLLVGRDEATNLKVSVNLDALARYLDAFGRGDLAAQYRRRSADLTWEDAPPAYAVGELPGICARSLLSQDPMPPRIATFCELVVAGGLFAVPYLPYTAFTGRTADGAEDLAAFDELCEQVEKALAPLGHGSLPLFVVPADDAALHAFAAARDLDPHEVWTGTLWAGGSPRPTTAPVAAGAVRAVLVRPAAALRRLQPPRPALT